MKGAAFRARRERTLDGEDRCERIGEGGKDLVVKWGKVSHDEDLAAAILDRVLERGRFILLRWTLRANTSSELGRSLAGRVGTGQNFRKQRLRISGTNNYSTENNLAPLLELLLERLP